jgi:hypothetical protein
MSNKYPRKPIEECLQFFLQQQSDELIPTTAIYKGASEQRDTARNEVIKMVPEEFRNLVISLLEKYDESFIHCKNLETEYIYTVAFKEAFRSVIFLLSNSYNPLEPLDFKE